MFPAESCLPFADYQCYARLSNKAELIDIAREKQIAIPRTCVFSSADSPSQIEEEARCIGFPVVIKPALSRVRTVHGWLSTRVHYARDANELRLVLDSDPSCGYPLLLQERVYGPGVGIFLLMNHGEVIARFAHKRIREKPPSGGVSVLCESIRPPSDALSAAEKLLRHLNWYGIAMVEFKRDGREGRAKLMEVNARFWGSLQLAISAGVDFPYLLYRMAAGEKVIPVLKYREGQKVRWELGDLDHLLMRMLKNPKQILLPKGAPNKKQVLKDFIKDFFDERVENEIFSIHDPGPFLFEVKNYLKDITGSARLCLRRSKACCSF
jgi:predicted ATP-grasp superfamily ATP-dependent carboligase